MLLDILIPTYNRAQSLEKNINLLAEYIQDLKVEDKVCIVISDNCSVDDTASRIKNIQDSKNINISLYHQKTNIGLEKNAVYVLSKSTAKYSMFLGDDDYLELEYLKEVIAYIEMSDITCIVPAFLAKTQDGRVIGYRSLGERKMFNKGFLAVYNTALLGHQLSGITFLREGTLEKYLEKEVLRNIYLFISFVGFNCLRGDVLHLTEYPVEVTVGEKKDWNYGDDALFSEKIKNVSIIYNRGLNRFRLERKFYVENIYGIFSIYSSKKLRLKALMLSTCSKHLSFFFKLSTPLILIIFGFDKIVHRISKFLGVK